MNFFLYVLVTFLLRRTFTVYANSEVEVGPDGSATLGLGSKSVVFVSNEYPEPVDINWIGEGKKEFKVVRIPSRVIYLFAFANFVVI